MQITPLLQGLLTVTLRTSISQSTITGVCCSTDPYTCTTIITWATYCYTGNQYIVEHNQRSMWCHRSLCICHHYYMGYLLLHWEPVYHRAQSEGYVVPQIPMHMPPLLHGLLTVTLRPSISQSTIRGVCGATDPYAYATIITGVTYCYTGNHYILEHNHRSMCCHRSQWKCHHYYMGYLLLHWESIYPRAQPQEYVVPPIPMHIPPLLQGYLLLHWEPVYPRRQSQEYVVSPITLHMPPFLHGLLLHT